LTIRKNKYNYDISESNMEGCPVKTTLEVIGGKMERDHFVSFDRRSEAFQ